MLIYRVFWLNSYLLWVWNRTEKQGEPQKRECKEDDIWKLNSEMDILLALLKRYFLTVLLVWQLSKYWFIWKHHDMMDQCAMPINVEQCAIKSLTLIQNASQTLVSMLKIWSDIDPHCTLIHHVLKHADLCGWLLAAPWCSTISN